jgi:hypothetical protein
MPDAQGAAIHESLPSLMDAIKDINQPYFVNIPLQRHNLLEEIRACFFPMP